MVLHRKIFSPVQKVQKIFFLVLLGSYVMGFGAGLSCCLENPDELPLRLIKASDLEVVERHFRGGDFRQVWANIEEQARDNRTLGKFLRSLNKHMGKDPFKTRLIQYYLREIREGGPATAPEMSWGTRNLKQVDTLILSQISLSHGEDSALDFAYETQGYLINSCIFDGQSEMEGEGPSPFSAVIPNDFYVTKLPDEWMGRSIEIFVWAGRHSRLSPSQIFNLLRTMALLKLKFGIEIKYIGDSFDVTRKDVDEAYIVNIKDVRELCGKQTPPRGDRNQGHPSCVCF